MKRPTFIARQAGNPSGILGRAIAWIMVRETAALNARAVELIDIGPSDHVLEVGYGHGATVERIAALATQGRVAGVDVSESMTRLAIHRNRKGVVDGRVDLRTGDCASLPFGDGQFDKALSIHTVYFWKEPLACLREISRVLRPGGRFVLGFTLESSRRVGSFPAEVYTFYDEEEIRGMLITAGFESMATTLVGEAALTVSTRANVHVRAVNQS
jgi:ubiquinone/menaquinone biosynthesis C-methylase UbiE